MSDHHFPYEKGTFLGTTSFNLHLQKSKEDPPESARWVAPCASAWLDLRRAQSCCWREPIGPPSCVRRRVAKDMGKMGGSKNRVLMVIGTLLEFWWILVIEDDWRILVIDFDFDGSCFPMKMAWFWCVPPCLEKPRCRFRVGCWVVKCCQVEPRPLIITITMVRMHPIVDEFPSLNAWYTWYALPKSIK